MATYRAEILENNRSRVTITEPDWCGKPRSTSYTTVRNIDGSNHLMRDGDGWDFLPHKHAYAAHAAIAMARGEAVPFAWCIPADAIIANT